METHIFEEMGFSKGEVKVYFALLGLGESSIGPLSKKAEVTAAKVYPILEKLFKKGLVNHIIKFGTKHFQVTNPKNIIYYLNEKTNKINEQKQEIKKLIPLIEEKQKLFRDKQSATIYETFNGIKSLYNEIIEYLKIKKEDFIAFSLGEEEYKYKESKHFFRGYDVKRRNLNIKIRLLSSEKQRKFLYLSTKDDKNIKIRYLPFSLPTGVIIYGDKVATLVWEEIPIAFVIQSKQTAKAYKDFFEDMWRRAKK